jgi:transposase
MAKKAGNEQQRSPGKQGEPKETRGRKHILDSTDIDALRERVAEFAGTPMVELVRMMEGRGKKVSGGTITSALRTCGFMQAKAKRPVSQAAPQTPPRYQPQHRRQPTPSAYPSNLTELEWSVLEPLLAQVRDPRGRKPVHSPQATLNAIFYVARTGCQWRQLPKDLPPWTAVWSTFRRLRDSGVLERLYEALFVLWRRIEGRSDSPTAGIIDSQTVKTTEKGGSADTTRERRSRGERGRWLQT